MRLYKIGRFYMSLQDLERNIAGCVGNFGKGVNKSLHKRFFCGKILSYGLMVCNVKNEAIIFILDLEFILCREFHSSGDEFV